MKEKDMSNESISPRNNTVAVPTVSFSFKQRIPVGGILYSAVLNLGYEYVKYIVNKKWKGIGFTIRAGQHAGEQSREEKVWKHNPFFVRDTPQHKELVKAGKGVHWVMFSVSKDREGLHVRMTLSQGISLKTFHWVYEYPVGTEMRVALPSSDDIHCRLKFVKSVPTE